MLRSFVCTAALALLAGPLAAAEGGKRPAGPAPFDVDRFFKQHDKDHKGYLTRDEVPEPLRDHFDEFDANRDGKLTKEELKRGVANLRPRRRPSDMIYVLIEMTEHDRDSVREVQRAYDILRSLDKNKNGKIDPEELQAVRERLVEDRVDAIFRDLDRNKDGKISREEARGQVLQNFDRIDTNKDGYIERRELLRAARKAEGAPGRGAPSGAPGRRDDR